MIKNCLLCKNYMEHPCTCEHCDEDCNNFRGSKEGKELIETISKKTARECRDFIKQWVGNDEEGLGFLFDFEEFIKKQYGVKVK